MPEELSPLLTEVRRLLLEIVDSFEKLDVLLRLHRDAGAVVSQSALFDALGGDPSFTHEAVEALAAAGLVAGTPAAGWRFVVDHGRAPVVHELARLHDGDRILVLNLMTAVSMERMRGQTARAFADAFVLGRRKKGDPDA